MGEKFNIILGLTCFISISLGNLLSIGLVFSILKKIFKNKRFDLIPEFIPIALIIISPSFISFILGGYSLLGLSNSISSKAITIFVFFCVGVSWTRSWWKIVNQFNEKNIQSRGY